MTKLIAKEARLAATPLTYFFMLAAFMTLLPGYPILVGTFFICLGIFYSFQNAREANDVVYSVLLPVKKTDIVKAKYAFCAVIEAVFFALIAALTVLRMTILSDAEAYKTNALMNPSPVYLAFVLLLFAAFNVIFLGAFFKTGWKIGIPFIVFTAVTLVLIFVAEALHYVPGLAFLNVTHGERLPMQFICLAAAAAVYALSFFASRAVSMKRFERVDL